MSNRVGRPKKYEKLSNIVIGITDEERMKLDQICSSLKLTRHEYLSACLNSDSNDGNRAIVDAELKTKDAEIYSLKKELDDKKKEIEQLNERLTKLETKLKQRENKKSKKAAKLQMQLEDIKDRCRRRIEACKNNVGELEYQRGTRDQYHNAFMKNLADKYKLLKIEGGENAKDEYLERELAKWL